METQLRNPIRVNHVGFAPQASKIFIITTPNSLEFTVCQLKDVEFTIKYHGMLRQQTTEFGEGWVGEFSELKEEGIYRIHCGEAISRCFIIYKEIYKNPVRVLLNYFEWQRCGDTHIGWNAPCHVNDGITLDSGEFRDLTGGYHQSSDLRKWSWGLSLGLIGLTSYALSQNKAKLNASVEQEMRWGSEYFRRLMREDGGIMDSTFIPSGWSPAAGVAKKGYQNYELLWGQRDFYESDAPAPAQWNSIRLQAMTAQYFKRRDPEYASICLEAAKKTWCYMNTHHKSHEKYRSPQLPPLGHDGMDILFSGFYEGSALERSHRLCASIQMYHATQEQSYLDDACKHATMLCELQIGRENAEFNPVSACFWEHDVSDILANSFFYFWNTSGPIGLCDILEIAPHHPDAERWKECVSRITNQSLSIAKRNVWNRVPAVWFNNEHNPFNSPAFFSFSSDHENEDGIFNAGVVGSKERNQVFDCSYKYYNFCYNLDIISQAIFMKRVSRVLNRSDVSVVAQSQLDWILGTNPFDASAVEAVGYNQPHRGLFGEFFPPTPQIPGAVCTGISPKSFEPEGYGLDNEYDLPMVGWLMWLMSDLNEK
jgi:hypothetical protein